MTSPDRLRPYDDDALNVGLWPPASPARLVTPPDEFFRRNHAPIPHVDAAAWRLHVEGLVEQPGEYALDALLARFPRREVTATLVCAGLRRAELLAVAPLPGELPWGPDAASTGCWSGIALGDVLREAAPQAAARHVEFLGLDRVVRHGREFGFGGSIDLAKALDGDVLLATHLDGAPLPPAQGFPVRVVVPGWIGARSVKWLSRIVVRADESDNYFQRQAYRLAREPGPAGPMDVSAGASMSTVALNAIVAEPRPDARVAAGAVTVRGWAIGGGGRPLTRVEISADGGAGWVPARIVAGGTRWTWSLWEATVQLAPGAHVLLARAADGVDEMPRDPRACWNVKGYGTNCWYRVPVVAA